jgi:hypothetical protein
MSARSGFSGHNQSKARRGESNVKSHRNRHKGALAKRSRRLLFEPLEERTLLAAGVIYSTDFDTLTPGRTLVFPGAPGQDGWYRYAASGDAYGEIQALIAASGQAFHQYAPSTNPAGRQTIDQRLIETVDVSAAKTITLTTDFYAHSDDLEKSNVYHAWLRVGPGQMISLRLTGGHAARKIDTGVNVTLDTWNGVNNNRLIKLNVGQALEWDAWHSLSLTIDQQKQRYESITVDGITEDLSMYELPWGPYRGNTLDVLVSEIRPSVTADGISTNDHVYWDNISLYISAPRITGHAPSGVLTAPVESLRITFDRKMDTNSFSLLEDVVGFTGPRGEITPTGFAWLDEQILEIFFEASEEGLYTLVLGPNILDKAGDPLDLDGDFLLGEEPDDQYIASFEIISPFVVTNTADSGLGSLRAAILAANSATEPVTITFRIPPSDPNFLDIDSDLPAGDPEPDAFFIRPLSPLPAISNPSHGIKIEGTSQSIFGGDTNPVGPEIVLDGSLVGTGDGIIIWSNHNELRGLNIQRFPGSGVAVANSANNLIAGNFIGTNALGSSPAPNGENGVVISGGAANNVIGTNGDGFGDQAERNVISGNLRSGILITGTTTHSNVIAGNLIGTDLTGMVALRNVQNGVAIEGGAKSNRVGTGGDGNGDAVEGNVIAGNFHNGIRISGPGTDYNEVYGNRIGTSVDGTWALGNGQRGVLISSGAQANRIGGLGALGNTIAYHWDAGIEVNGATTRENRLLGNSIYGNGGLGIDLGGDGPTENDPLDLDDGPNSLQNYPVLSLGGAGQTTHVAGTLHSVPAGVFTLDFYAATETSQRFLGSESVTTDALGNAVFEVELPKATLAHEVLLATARDSRDNTSEFSAPFRLADPPEANAGGPYSVSEGGTVTFDGRASRDPVGRIESHEWDLDYDGVAFHADAEGDVLEFHALDLDGPATRTIALRVSSEFGLTHIDTALLTIHNVAPSVSLAGPANDVRNRDVTFTFTASDPSQADRASSFTYTIDWGNGRTATVTGGQVLNVTHRYNQLGSYQISVTATDKDGGVSDSAYHTITIHRVWVEEETNQLLIGGTEGDDTITLTTGSVSVRIEYTDDHGDEVVEEIYLHDFELADVARVVVFGGQGDDFIDARAMTNLPTTLYGGEGNDQLFGGALNDILVGGEGDDHLDGGGGANFLAAGGGENTILVGPHDTVQLYENDVFPLTAKVDGPGPFTIAWGDGALTPGIQPSKDGTIHATHRFLDDGDYQVVIFDAHQAPVAGDRKVSVANLPPRIDRFEVLSNAPDVAGFWEAAPIQVQVQATDPGPMDVVTYHCFVTWNETVVVEAPDPEFTFTPPDNGRYHVACTASDGDGGSTRVLKWIDVQNQPPTIDSFTVPPVVDEGQLVTATASASDPAGPYDPVSLSWSVTRDGTLLRTGSGTQFEFTPDDNGIYQVTVVADDGDGGVTSRWQDIKVRNVAPTVALLLRPEPEEGESLIVTEGHSVSVTASISDAGGRDTHTYFWQVTDVSGQLVHWGTQAIFQFAPPDNGTYRVTFTATDKDGDSGTAQATFTATNVAPTATFSGNSEATYGQAVTIRFTDPFDPSTADTAAGFRYSFALDPIELAVTWAQADTAAQWSPILDAGPYTVYGRIFDKDHAFSQYARTLTIHKADQHLQWDTPVSILHGDVLTDQQLNATVSVPGPAEAGELSYSHGIGTLLGIGEHELTVTVAGTPNYHEASLSVGLKVLKPYSISGLVFVDLNNDGLVDAGESGIADVTITLTGTNDRGKAVLQVLQTDEFGMYKFAHLRPGKYYVTQRQPEGYLQGINSVGTLDGQISAVDQFYLDLGEEVLDANVDTDGLYYNFGERPDGGQIIEPGQTAGIGFWQNRNGQTLIQSLNDGPDATQLSHWLARTLPNMFGHLRHLTNAEVGHYYQSLFGVRGQKLEAQVMATALSVYVTDVSSAGRVGEAYGFLVSTNGLGTRTYNVGTRGAAFCVNDDSELTVLDLLRATDTMTKNGDLYHSDDIFLMKALRTMANEVYSDINK